MRILVVTQYFWPESFRINDLVSGLHEKGHEIEVLTGIPNYPSGRFFRGYRLFNKKKDQYQGVTVYRAPLVPRGGGGGLRLALNFFSFAVFASFLAPVYCRKKYDVIFVYEPSPITVLLPALTLKMFKSIPIIFWMQDLWPESLSATGAVRSAIILKLVEQMVRLIYKGCDLILAQSKAFIPSIIRLGGQPARIVYYPNSAETFYQPLTLPADAPENRQMPEGFRVTFAGNIGAAQDFETIIKAAQLTQERSKDVHWIILGDGRMSHWVREQIQRSNLTKSVHLLGRYPAEQIPRFFAFSDVLLITLKKEPIFALTIPSKVQSCLACGRPIIAALDGEGGRIIREAEAGLVCPPEDPEALANSVMAMYRKPIHERNDMGLRGRKYFTGHFERQKLLQQLESWMEGLVENPKPAA
jgi:glycosyltransferase involved in cell wall biosynthesis